MRISEQRRLNLLAKAHSVMASRNPDLIIGDKYVERWMMRPKNRWFNVYIHRFNISDSDEALHDHEPDNISLILKGRCREHFHASPLAIEHVDGKPRYKTEFKVRTAGDIVFRRAGTPHRIELIDGEPMETMFINLVRRRHWGFWCTTGWKKWEDYIESTSYGNRRGKGCGS